MRGFGHDLERCVATHPTATELNSWLEDDSVTNDIAQNLLEVAIVNFFGPDALENE
jgi:hypothetical protein